MPRVTPPAVVLAHLAAGRRDGLSFAVAWPLAVDGALAAVERVERGQWALALTATREAWQDAYDREPATRHTRALATIADDREARDGRMCERCDAPIAASKSPAARFCSTACQRAASRPPAIAA